VAKEEDVKRVVATGIQEHGKIDVLINNAGTSNTREPIAFDDLDAMSEAFWAKIMQTNLIGAFRCARAASPALRSAKGVIVSTASVAGLGVPGSSIAYGASKAGLINLTRSLAHALAPDVRVNAVAPGLVRTPWTDPWPDERKAQTIANCLLDRMVEPEEISATMLFLACNPAITGQTVAVDCGRTC
jgi:3-oxoacyl-[acyl-carrier protein] reductase